MTSSLAFSITSIILSVFSIITPFGEYPIPTQDTEIKLMATDASMTEFYLEVSDTDFINYMDEATQIPYGYDITFFEQLLRHTMGKCLDTDNMSTSNITMHRNMTPSLYHTTAKAPLHVPSYIVPNLGIIVPEKYLLSVEAGSPSGGYGYTTGINAFTIPLPTIPCNE